MQGLSIASFIVCICFVPAFGHYNESGTRFDLPKCMNVTIAKVHYIPEARTVDDSIGGYDIGTIPDVQFGPDNKSVSFCFPLSPQLLNCKIRKFGRADYRKERHVLRLLRSYFSAKLGDYFIDQDDNAYVCSVAIQADRSMPRCNFITLESGMYAELGNNRLYINSTQSILEKATYSIDIKGTATACYPLSIHALNCKPYYFTLHPEHYTILPKFKIGYNLHNKEEYGPSEYFQLNTNGDLRVCIPSSPKIEHYFTFVYYVLAQISLIFLCLTLIFQLTTRQSNLHDKCLACYNVTMMAYYITFNIPIIIGTENCHIFFIIDYTFKMSSQTWLTLTTYDIWKSFTSMRTSPNRRTLRRKTTFLHYSIVGWLSPFLWYFLVLITNNYISIFSYEWTVDMPNCWFKAIWAYFAFYFGPMLILNAINIVFFIYTIRAIHREAKKAQAARSNGKKQVIIVSVKLFIIMGVGLIIDGIMMAIQRYINFHYYYVSGAYKCTEGISIFIVVLCRREAARTIFKQWTELRLKWNALTTECDIFIWKKQSIPIYLVEENHLNLSSKRSACQFRSYVLHEDDEGDIFPRNKAFMMDQEMKETSSRL